MCGLQTQCLCHMETFNTMKKIGLQNDNTRLHMELSEKAQHRAESILKRGKFSWQEGEMAIS